VLISGRDKRTEKAKKKKEHPKKKLVKRKK
jgi:hypothetical protein